MTFIQIMEEDGKICLLKCIQFNTCLENHNQLKSVFFFTQASIESLILSIWEITKSSQESLFCSILRIFSAGWNVCYRDKWFPESTIALWESFNGRCNIQNFQLFTGTASASGMDFPIPPTFRWSTDTFLADPSHFFVSGV